MNRKAAAAASMECWTRLADAVWSEGHRLNKQITYAATHHFALQQRSRAIARMQDEA